MSDKLDFAGRQRASELLDWIVDCPEEAAHRLAALEAENAELKRENEALRALFKPGDADLLLTVEETEDD